MQQNKICMVAERSQDPPSARACFFPLHSPHRSRSAMLAEEKFVRPGMLDQGSGEVGTPVVSSQVLFNAMAAGLVVIGKKVFQHWRKYRHEDERPPIHPHTSTESLEEMDSLGSRLDGVLAFQDRQVAPPEVAQQQGQLFLKEFKIQEKKFEEKLLQLQRDFNTQLQRMQIGLDNRDQEQNKDIQELRQELKRHQATISEPNKLIEEIIDNDNRAKTVKNEKDIDTHNKTIVDDLCEYDKKAGVGSWKVGCNKLITIAPTARSTAASYSMAIPRHTIGELVDAWVHDCMQHGGNISERNVDADGNIIHNWG